MEARLDASTHTQRSQWDASAKGWDANSALLDAWLATPTQTMIRLAGIGPGSRVLDIAAGAGGQTVDIAAVVGRAGSILATDISPELVERVRRNLADARCAVEAQVADAQLPLDRADAFDAAVCRLSLMLMPEPEKCLASTHAALKPGGRFSAMVFAGPEKNPCIRILMTTALRHAGLPPRDPFARGGLLSLGRPGALDALLDAAGFADVSTLEFPAPFPAPSVDEYMTFIREAAAPIRGILANLPREAQEAAWTDMRGQLAQFTTPEGWTGPKTLLVTTGRKRKP